MGRSKSDKASSVQKSDPRGQKKGFTQVMGYKDDGFAEPASQGEEFALKLGASDWVERAKGLIHEQNGGVGSKGASYAYTLALAARKFPGLAA